MAPLLGPDDLDALSAAAVEAGAVAVTVSPLITVTTDGLEPTVDGTIGLLVVDGEADPEAGADDAEADKSSPVSQTE